MIAKVIGFASVRDSSTVLAQKNRNMLELS